MASPAKIFVDTKTREVSVEDGGGTIYFKSVTLKLDNVQIVDSSGTRTISLGSTNGTKIGATGDRIGFLGASPIVRPAGNIFTALSNLGLVNTPSLLFSNLSSRPTTITGYGITDYNSLGDARWSLLGHAHAFSALTSKPTTIAGYGITDFNSLGDARWSLLGHAHAFSALTSKPTTIDGYGITDFNSLGDARWSLLGHAHAFSELTSKPTTIAGFGITDNTFANLLSKPTTIAGFGITDNTFANLLSKPSTLAGYGITDLVAKTDTANTFVPLQTFNSFASYSVTATQLSNPGAPSITNVGTAGATTWTYKIVAKLADGSTTAGGTAGTTTTGNATLDATNKNSLTWSAVAGASTYDVYRTVAGLVPSSLGKLVNVSSPAYIDAGATGDLSIAPTTNSTGSITATDGTFGRNVKADSGNVSSATSSTSGNSSVGGNSTVTGNQTIGGTETVTGNLTAPIRDKGGQVFNAITYGIVADGSTDNTSAINAMFAAGAAASSPVFLFPLNGVIITSQVTPPSGSTLAGSGMGLTTLKAKSGSTFSTVLFITGSNVTVRDLTLDGNRGNVGTGGLSSSLSIEGNRHLIERVELTHSEFCGAFVGSNSASPLNVTIDHCWIHDNGGTILTGNGVGIFTGGTFLPVGLSLTNNIVVDNHNTVTRPNDSSGMNLTVNSVVVSGNYFKNNYNVAGGQLSTNGAAAISDNIIELTGSFGTPVDQTSGIEVAAGYFTVTGNHVLGYSGAGINVEGVLGEHGTITANTISGGPVGAGGIVLYGNQTDPVSNVAIAGNLIKATYAILLTNANRNITIAGNELHESTNAYAVTGGSLDSSVTGDIIPRPLTTYTPTVTAGTGTITSYTATGAYLQTGKLVFVEITINIVTNGSAASDIIATLPVQASSRISILSGRENAINGAGLIALVSAFTTQVHITKYDNTYMGGNGAVLVISGTYESQ